MIDWAADREITVLGFTDLGGKKSMVVHLAPTVRAPVSCCLKRQSQLSLKIRGKVLCERMTP